MKAKYFLLVMLLAATATAQQPVPVEPDKDEIIGTLEVDIFNPIVLTCAATKPAAGTVKYRWRCIEATGDKDAHRNDFVFKLVDSGATVYAWAPPATYEIECLIITSTADAIDLRETFATVEVMGPRPPPVPIPPDPPTPTDTKSVIIIYDVAKTTAAHNSVLSDARLDQWTEDQGAGYLKILSKKTQNQAGEQHALVTKLLPSIPATASLPHYFLLDASQNIVGHGDLPTSWDALKTIIQKGK